MKHSGRATARLAHQARQRQACHLPRGRRRALARLRADLTLTTALTARADLFADMSDLALATDGRWGIDPDGDPALLATLKQLAAELGTTDLFTLVQEITDRLDNQDLTEIEAEARAAAQALETLLAAICNHLALAATILALALTASRRLSPQTSDSSTSPRSGAPPGRRRRRHRPVAGCSRRANKEAGHVARLRRPARCRRRATALAG